MTGTFPTKQVSKLWFDPENPSLVENHNLATLVVVGNYYFCKSGNNLLREWT